MVTVFRPRTLNEALATRASCHTTLFAGGTDLMVAHGIRDHMTPTFEGNILFVDNLAELKHITLLADGAKLSIGAGVSLAQIEHHPDVPPLLKQAVARIAAPALRNRATLIGNICNASPAADSLPALYLFDCDVVIQSQSAQRKVKLSEFICGLKQTLLQADEIVTHVEFSLQNWTHNFYHKVGTRAANALTKVSVAGVARIYGDQILDWRVAFGAVGTRVIREPDIEALIINTPVSQLAKRIPSIINQYDELIKPISDQRSTAEYRSVAALNLLRRWLMQLGCVDLLS